MMAEQPIGATAAPPEESLFLQYLSTGQFECARLAFKLLVNHASDSSSQATKEALVLKQARLVAAGYRPVDWMYSSSCPSQAHLSWLCQRLLDDDDSSSSSATFIAFTLAASALLGEAGVAVEQAPFGRPSERTKRFAELLLSSTERLSRLLCGPSFLACLVWRELRRFVHSVDMRNEIVRGSVEILVKAGRVEDATSLISCGPDDDAEVVESLARACGDDDEIAERVTMALLSNENNDNRLTSARTFRRIMQFRKSGGEKDIASMLVRALRQDDESRHTDWFTEMVDDPFAVRDSPLAVRLVHLLTTVSGEPQWCERLLQVQQAVSLLTEIPSTEMIPTPNDLVRTLQHRVNRLGFALLCAECLTRSRDMRSARIAHELRTTPLPKLIVTRVPPFDLSAVERLGRGVRVASGADSSEKRHLGIVKLAVWIADLVRSNRPWSDLQARAVEIFTETFAKEDEDLKHSAVEFIVDGCLDHVRIMERALLVVDCLLSMFPLNSKLREAQVRLRIGDVLLDGDVSTSLHANPRDLIIACLDRSRWQLAFDLADVLGDESLKQEAQDGLLLNGETDMKNHRLSLSSTAQIDAIIAELPVSFVDDDKTTSALLSTVEDENDRNALEAVWDEWTRPTQTRFDPETLLLLQGVEERRPATASPIQTDLSSLPSLDDSPQRLREWLSERESTSALAMTDHLSRFVAFLADACETLSVQRPRELLRHGLNVSIVSHVMGLESSKNRTEALVDMCERFRVDPRMVLIDASVRMKFLHQQEDLVSILNEVEGRFPILNSGLDGDDPPSLLRKVFFPSAQEEEEDGDDDASFRRMRLLQQSSDTNKKGETRSIAFSLGEVSDYSLEGAQADVEVAAPSPSANDDSLTSREPDWFGIEWQRLQNRVNSIEQNEDAGEEALALERKLEASLNSPRDLDAAFELLQSLHRNKHHPLADSMMTTRALQLAAACLGLRVDSAGGGDDPVVIPDEDSDDDVLRPDLAAQVLNQLSPEASTRNTWRDMLVTALRSDVYPPMERPVVAAAAAEFIHRLE